VLTNNLIDLPYGSRIASFLGSLDKIADFAFVPVSSDLQYLTGVQRTMPNFGDIRHPGDWLEGGWFVPNHDPILTLSRMSAEFNALNSDAVEVQIIGDHDNPGVVVKSLLGSFSLPEKPRIALGEKTTAETIVHLHRFFPDATFLSASEILAPQRRVKSEQEIGLMRQAGAMTIAAFGNVLLNLKHGMTELDVITETYYQLRKQGSLGSSFDITMYNSGPNHELIFGHPEQTQNRVLNPPVALLFDFGAIYQGYCYDFGRTVFFGEPDQNYQNIFNLVMDSQAAGIAALKAGDATTSDTDAAARQVITDAGFGNKFRHRLGHGIGLDVHESPFLTAGDETPLEEGMLFTIEPSITQFDGFSARVEDVVVARKGGGEPLTTEFKDMLVV